MTKLQMALGAAAIALIGGAAAWLLHVPPPAQTPDDPAQIAEGGRVYAANCASCHGAKLEGEANWRDRKPSGRLPAPPHDASGHTWHHPDAYLFGVTKYRLKPYAPPGYESDMPAFEGSLSDAEIGAVLAFIKNSWPQEIQGRQREISEQAK